MSGTIVVVNEDTVLFVTNLTAILVIFSEASKLISRLVFLVMVLLRDSALPFLLPKLVFLVIVLFRDSALSFLPMGRRGLCV
ncbi:hypothetical protein FR483_n608R [Paramecium bursaria Chlorella virus FR483]|uniref:Uncharacterized protein n608R n=1 Tax=Paramecium bursaria Chlorella virus FR483 TaxID=399781 RepID=A7J7W2_PBCVF|nr:hypothetical protein FR483_n608R [Paramecium bursaria Chlorella virus FR483]ABT15893.1 hypothetical protein FR483_n608R [Paramecium bursaria Chlorella virus FR483]